MQKHLIEKKKCKVLIKKKELEEFVILTKKRKKEKSFSSFFFFDLFEKFLEFFCAKILTKKKRTERERGKKEKFSLRKIKKNEPDVVT